jgi:protein-disulfide isomerase
MVTGIFAFLSMLISGDLMETSLKHSSKEPNEILLYFLLTLQVVLSAIILFRILNLEKLLSQSTNSNDQLSSIFVEGITNGSLPPLGKSSAKVTIIEFSDYQCPYCAEANEMINSIMDKYQNQILFFYRDYPLSEIHPKAYIGSLAARCANDQGAFWKMHDYIFSNQEKLDKQYLIDNVNQVGMNKEKFAKCLSSEEHKQDIQNDINDGKKYGVRGTPTFFINGYLVAGGDKNSITSIIEAQLAK